MRLHKKVFRSAGYDSIPADRAGLAECPGFHPVDIADIRDTRRLIKFAQIIRQVRIVDDPAEIASIADEIDRIEANKIR